MNLNAQLHHLWEQYEHRNRTCNLRAQLDRRNCTSCRSEFLADNTRTTHCHPCRADKRSPKRYWARMEAAAALARSVPQTNNDQEMGML